MSQLGDLHRRWMKDSEYRMAFEDMKPEFELTGTLIQARAEAGLTQEQVAQRMETSQAVIARVESGRVKPSTRFLERYAAVVGKRVRISLEPA